MEKKELEYQQELLAKYNENNAKNSALTEYINKNNLFQIIGKERSELVHSKFIANLIAGSYSRSGCTESTAMHFLDILLKRSKMQETPCDFSNLEKKGNQLEEGILTRKSRISFIEYKTEYALSKYIEDNLAKDGKVEDYIWNQFKDKQVEKSKLVDNVKKSKLDIYIKMKIYDIKKIEQTVEIFIENKVESKQNDFKIDNEIVTQTEKYYKVCSKAKTGKGNRNLQLFVYLTPISQRELDKIEAKKSDIDEHFIQINYQDILNYVIEPLLADTSLTEVQRMRLADYVNCLELPSLSDEEDASNVKDLSIMATSEHEKNLIERYLMNSVNKELLDTVIRNQLMMKKSYNFYKYGEHRMLSFNEALNKALADFVSSHSEFEALQKLDIIEKKGGNTGQYNPFLMYCPVSVEDGFVPYDLFVYKDEICLTVAKALEQALKDCRNAKIDVDKFDIFDTRGKGTNTSAFTEADSKLKIRDDIGPKQLNRINSELKRVYEKNSQVPEIRKIKAEQLHSYLANCKKGMLNVADSKKENYSRVGETNYYYRNDAEKYRDDISKILKDIKPIESKGIDGENLLTDFYDSNKPFLLSVYKIQMENTTDSNEYDYRKKCFKELCKI